MVCQLLARLVMLAKEVSVKTDLVKKGKIRRMKCLLNSSPVLHPRGDGQMVETLMTRYCEGRQ